MNAATEKVSSRALGTGTVVPLRPRAAERANVTTESFLTLDVLEQHLADMKAQLEAMVTREIAQQLQSGFSRPSPFDAVYIADVRPDPVSRAALERLKRFAGINDLSDQLTFEDALDD